MVEDELTCSFLLAEVRARLPLCDSFVRTAMGRRVVVSRPTELFAGGAAMAFVPCAVAERAAFTAETLRSVYDLAVLLREQAGEGHAFKCFLVFIDNGGTFSFYRMDTLCA